MSRLSLMVVPGVTITLEEALFERKAAGKPAGTQEK